jgi:hypothetical protein
MSGGIYSQRNRDEATRIRIISLRYLYDRAEAKRGNGTELKLLCGVLRRGVNRVPLHRRGSNQTLSPAETSYDVCMHRRTNEPPRCGYPLIPLSVSKDLHSLKRNRVVFTPAN